MAQLAQRYRDDDEAAIFYALALNEAVDLDDKTYARQFKAAAKASWGAAVGDSDACDALSVFEPDPVRALEKTGLRSRRSPKSQARL